MPCLYLLIHQSLCANSKSKTGNTQLFAASGVVGAQGMKGFWSGNYEREIGSGWASQQIPRGSGVSL
eukprot:7530001-Ditylum_brightwellii.AAC.1